MISGRYIGVSSVRELLEYSYVLFSRRLRRSRRGNAASYIISQRKTGCVGGVAIGVIVVLGFVCDNQRDLRETTGVSFVQYNLSMLACYSPADSADHAEKIQQHAFE